MSENGNDDERPDETSEPPSPGGSEPQPTPGGSGGEGQNGPAGQPGTGSDEKSRSPGGGDSGPTPTAGQGGPGTGGPPGTTGQPTSNATESGPSLVDKLQRPAVLDELKTFVGTFAVVGVGLAFAGLLPFVLTNFRSEGEPAVATLAIVFVGISLAAVLSLRFADSVDEERSVIAVGAGVGSVIGFFILGFVNFIVVVLGAGGSASLFVLFLALFAGGVVTLMVGAATAFIGAAVS